ncbi:MAG: ChaN family lipoprotein [Leptolyngbyaceae cyanobacterium bins.302]|nr:ChaN family lipoprotein [Leptolyngbyaceae cyanobacterium bins.302]
MTGHPEMKFWAVLLGVWVLCCPPHASASNSIASRIYNLKTEQNQEIGEVMQRLAQANVVYLAETHDRPQDHQTQLEILRSLHHRRPLLIGMEMFQRPFQWALNQYLAGQMTEAELVRLTEYQRRWGYDWEMYAPILRFARENQVPVIALNTPSEVTRKVARVGLDQLTLAERQWIPPKSTVLAKPDAYRQRIRQIYDEIHQGKGNSASFERFFQAQVLWDETMAHQIEIVLQRSPQSLVVVLAGQGHILYGDGIPDRVQRRTAARIPGLKQATVILNPSTDIPSEPGVADYFWYSP